MKLRDQGDVVVANLNVYGTVESRVADLSIAPENAGANTPVSALLVGEKAAVNIGRELGIQV